MKIPIAQKKADSVKIFEAFTKLRCDFEIKILFDIYKVINSNIKLLSNMPTKIVINKILIIMRHSITRSLFSTNSFRMF